MRKKSVRIILVSMICMLLMGCRGNEDISLILGGDVSGAKMIAEKDSYGGFHGDGERYIEFQFEDNRFEDTIRRDNTWHILPVQDDRIEALLYGKEIAGITYGPYLQWKVPDIEEGYYFFYDRHKNCINPFDTSHVLRRNSLNVTIALYDSINGRLYFAELDT